ncbi:hypothetical protein PROFUN_11635 [Planoprotostelium fungivorum]|uniref:SnoaL-like domain-containing protein n=1 Tax=Planoprotostelium fungivorum TaxID=1890364 RepID=A0A2P6N9N8_9EUKA|nr:hypothetical protein PROFUN_11635 [Planoprotostelium fungivorum]
MRSVLLLALLTVALVGAQEDPAISSISNTTTTFFQLFELPCTSWASLFEKDAVFYHPNVPEGVRGISGLIKFCEGAQSAKGVQQFRQDGHMRITKSGQHYHALVEYVYSVVKDNGRLFTNSGWENLIFSYKNGATTIKEVTEYFNRNSLPYTWDPSS